MTSQPENNAKVQPTAAESSTQQTGATAVTKKRYTIIIFVTFSVFFFAGAFFFDLGSKPTRGANQINLCNHLKKVSYEMGVVKQETGEDGTLIAEENNPSRRQHLLRRTVESCGERRFESILAIAPDFIISDFTKKTKTQLDPFSESPNTIIAYSKKLNVYFYGDGSITMNRDVSEADLAERILNSSNIIFELVQISKR